MKFKKITLMGFVISFFVSTFLFSPPVDAYVNVKGYTRKDGTYVAPHVRSNPNGVKYDNYSYKSNQGLYNKTYGTRDTEWDTPTYVTDPDYYTGKQLYENSNSGSSYYSPTPIVTTPSCQTNETYNYTYEKCVCKTGYKENSYGSCVSYEKYCQEYYGYGATTNSTGQCQCKSGYIYDTSGTCLIGQTYCEKIYGTRGEFNSLTNTCSYCELGYHAKNGFCYADTPTCSVNAHLESDNKCYCDNGYVVDSTGQQCIPQQSPSVEGLKIETEDLVIEKFIQPTVFAVRIRQNPSLTARVVGTASSKTIYKVIEDNGGDWIKINFGLSSKKEGWVAKRYVQYR
ncbi:MAG TPA: SH3 domain-containing protein [Candidatus Magasanikbacteria bacterium]|nr:SH3 domain-containing protein [Candidatus Magasanikbacteria bacterium]